MILFPALDLKAGQCVRLKQGDMAQVTLFNTDPVEQAQIFESQGFGALHVVDLDGAVAGHSLNTQVIERVIQKVKLPLQLGGGLRTRTHIETWLAKGITRVILGTAAVRNPALVKEMARAYPERIVVGIDARHGYVAVDGWTQASEITAIDLCHRFEDAGVAAVIYTDIARDGMLEGLNLETTLSLAQAVDIPIIASGGLASLSDLQKMLEAPYTCLKGVIAGRALYDGRLNPQAALALLQAHGYSQKGLQRA